MAIPTNILQSGELIALEPHWWFCPPLNVTIIADCLEPPFPRNFTEIWFENSAPPLLPSHLGYNKNTNRTLWEERQDGEGENWPFDLTDGRWSSCKRRSTND